MKKMILPVSFVALTMLLIIAFTGCGSPLVSGAKVYIQQNNYDKAIEQCKLALEQNSQDAEAYYVMGEAYYHKNMFAEMNDAFTQSLAIDVKHTDKVKYYREVTWSKLFNDGVRFINEGNYEKSAAKFLEASNLLADANHLGAFKNLAYAYNQLGNDSLALETYKRAIKVDSSDMELKYYLGTMYYNKKQYDSAIDALNEVIINVSPDSSIYNDALLQLAYSYDVSGESDKAIETYDNALKLRPADKDILFNKGRLLYMQKNYDDAAKTWEKVIELDPNDFETHMNIANAYIVMGDSLKKVANEQDDSFKFIRSEEERNEIMKKAVAEYTLALPLLEKASELKSENANVWQNLGYVYYWIEEHDKSKAAFDKFKELSDE